MHYETEWDSQREKRTEEAEGTPAHHSAFIPLPLLTAGCSDSRIGQNTFGWFPHLNFGLSCFSSFRLFFLLGTGRIASWGARTHLSRGCLTPHQCSIRGCSRWWYQRLWMYILRLGQDIYPEASAAKSLWAQESHCILISLIDITSALLGSTFFFHTV